MAALPAISLVVTTLAVVWLVRKIVTWDDDLPLELESWLQWLTFSGVESYSCLQA